MALTGEVTDLSLAELIEFYCNQRKSGRLTVSYPHGAAYFYLQSGSVVHASIGGLRGIEAVYFALTQSNASFNFSSAYEAPDHTINQPWTSVVLEGLRRMDEGIKPSNPYGEKSDEFPPYTSAEDPPEEVSEKPVERVPLVQTLRANTSAQVDQPTPQVADQFGDKPADVKESDKFSPLVTKTPDVPEYSDDARVDDSPESSVPTDMPAMSNGFLSSTQSASKFSSGPWKLVAVFAALILIVAGVAVPWYARGRAARATNQATPPPAESSTQAQVPDNSPQTPAQTDDSQAPADMNGTTATSDAARKEREARAREEAKLKAKANDSSAPATSSTAPAQAPASATAAQPAANSGSKKAVVTVTYDENGRVTGASGSDPTALRIARQKRFPPGKAGSATVTIPIN